VIRAAYEESRILWRRTPIDRLLADSHLPEDERRKLELVLEARDFAAAELGFEVGGSYASLSRIENPAIVHVLTAARRDRLENVTWWYPIVGRMPYKGFFSKDEAALAALALEEKGYDTYVRPSAAFSTLGWFDDPLLSTLLRLDPVSLVEVVLHEIFHATLFVPGKMTFNESAAVFAGHRGAIEFFCREERPSREPCEVAERRWRDARRVSAFVGQVTEEVGRFYELKGEETTEEDRRRIFAALHERFQQVPFETDRYKRLSVREWNNAVLLHERTYFHELDLFEALYVETGTLEPTIVRMRAAVDGGDNPYAAVRAALGPPPVVAETGSPRG
jgi:predicted aminopeptidase